MTESRFFAGYVQKDIAIRQFRAKSPVFYPRLNFMAAVFSADLASIQAAMGQRCLNRFTNRPC